MTPADLGLPSPVMVLEQQVSRNAEQHNYYRQLRRAAGLLLLGWFTTDLPRRYLHLGKADVAVDPSLPPDHLLAALPVRLLQLALAEQGWETRFCYLGPSEDRDFFLRIQVTHPGGPSAAAFPVYSCDAGALTELLEDQRAKEVQRD